MTHRDMLRRDLDEALAHATTWRIFHEYLEGLGYSFPRDSSYRHPTIIAPGWKRPIRIDKLGEQYSSDAIQERLEENQYDPALYAVRIIMGKSALTVIVRIRFLSKKNPLMESSSVPSWSWSITSSSAPILRETSRQTRKNPQKR